MSTLSDHLQMPFSALDKLIVPPKHTSQKQEIEGEHSEGLRRMGKTGAWYIVGKSLTLNLGPHS